MGHRFWGLVYAVPESYWERAVGTSGRNVKREEEREREYKTDEPAIANSPIPPTMGPDGRVLTDRI